jgi:uncharacterized protein
MRAGGLTAYDTQRLEQMYFETDTAETAGKKAIMGARRWISISSICSC